MNLGKIELLSSVVGLQLVEDLLELSQLALEVLHFSFQLVIVVFSFVQLSLHLGDDLLLAGKFDPGQLARAACFISNR